MAQQIGSDKLECLIYSRHYACLYIKAGCGAHGLSIITVGGIRGAHKECPWAVRIVCDTGEYRCDKKEWWYLAQGNQWEERESSNPMGEAASARHEFDPGRTNSQHSPEWPGTVLFSSWSAIRTDHICPMVFAGPIWVTSLSFWMLFTVIFLLVTWKICIGSKPQWRMGG